MPLPPPEDLPLSEIKPLSLLSPALAGEFFTTSAKIKDDPVKYSNDWKREKYFEISCRNHLNYWHSYFSLEKYDSKMTVYYKIE